MGKMELIMKYGSHIPVIVKALSLTSGDVLEMGAGLTSTPFLHWMTSPFKRKLVTYENDPEYYNGLRQFQDDYHQVLLIDDWDKAEIEKNWDVALIDHAPNERRKIDIARLKDYARYIIVHDTYHKQEHHYDYNSIYPLFKYRFDYNPMGDRYYMPYSTVLSSSVDLQEFRDWIH